MDEDTGMESVMVAVPGKGLQKVTINTSKIQEKAIAARGIYEHAAALGASFGPYCKVCLDTFLPLLQFKFSSELRGTAAQTISAVFEAACCHGDSVGMALPSEYLPIVTKALAQQIAKEDDAEPEILYALAEALSDVLCSVYHRLEDASQLVSGYSNETANVVVKCCMTAMSACLGRRSKVATVLSGADGALSGEDEQEDLLNLLKSEDGVLVPLVDSVGYSLKFLRQAFVPIFDAEVAPILSPHLKGGHDIRARLSAVCLFDDCVEHCGAAAAAKFSPALVEGAVIGLDDRLNGQDPELKRASIYGIAQISRYSPSVLAPYEKQILPPLLSIAGGSKAEDDDDAMAVFESTFSIFNSIHPPSGFLFLMFLRLSSFQMLCQLLPP